MTQQDAAQPLKDFQAQKDYFIGIDSDGCVFDTMEIKWKECFIPTIIRHWGLQAISKYAREVTEFVNLYSKWRGINRWPALLKCFDLMAQRDDIRRRGVEMPRVEALRDWVGRETKLGHPALVREIERTGDELLKKALCWSEAVNRSIAETVEGVPPFPYMRESLEKMVAVADTLVVSQTPTEALRREWEEHAIDGYVKVIAGQEMGTKSEHFAFAAGGGRYKADHVLMIGDAPGDLKAARDNDVLFYPVNPGDEEASWKRFHDEALDRFIQGRYAGDYEAQLIAEFDAYLPATPPWEK